jgi:prepilin-type N-terminal cleavage/methylation domain-containing protein
MKSNKPNPSNGFTLTELLVVIGIIAVLGALLVSLTSGAVSKAQKAAAAQNLRSIAAGIVAYSTENQNRLPGPLNVGQSALYNGDKRGLLTFIAPYLYVGLTPSPTTIVPGFGSPALMKRMNAANPNPPVVYRMTGGLTPPPGRSGDYPWIWIDAKNPPAVEPRPWMIDDILPHQAGKVTAMIEQDQSLGGSWTNNGATAPSFGNERMALFYDWSARSIKVK